MSGTSKLRRLQRLAVPVPEVASLLDSLADASILVDAANNILHFNGEAEKFTAFSRNLVLGHPFAEVFEDNPWLVRLLQRTVETSAPHTDRQAVLRYGPDFSGRGGEVPVTATVTPWMSAKGELLGALILLSDRTRLQELERDLLRSDRLASLGTVAAGLAHEIKNPLGAIKGAAQLLERSAADSSSKELSQVVLKETERVNAILENLLRFARHQPAAGESVNLHVVLNEVVQLAALSPAGEGKRFEKLYDPSLPPVRGSGAALKQVFLNLVQNAAEASSPGGLVEVTTRFVGDLALRGAPLGPARGFLQVCVRDEGQGIEPEHLARLFTPFFTTKERGTGLGLVLSHQIVKEHGGFLTVESVRGRGSRFFVHLPRGD